MLVRKPFYYLLVLLNVSYEGLAFWLKRLHGVWKFWGLLAAGLMTSTFLQAEDTPHPPLILSLPLAQLSLWDAKSTDGFVEQLQGNKKQTPWSQEQINHARFLFSRLQKNKITIKKTLPALLAKAEPTKRSILCRKSLHYFQHAGQGEISTTGGLTSMVMKQKHINDFVKRPLNSIQRVARSSPPSVITSIYHYKGFPANSQIITDFLGWEFWWLQEGDMRILDRELLRAFSSMFHGKGLPKPQAVKDYLDLDVWWQQEGDKKILDRKLLRAFSSMFCGKGLPKPRAVKDYLDLDVWWQQEGDKRILDRELLRAFSSMFRCKGLPKAREVQDYLERDVWWQQEGGKKILDRELLRTFFPMFHGKGLPDIGQSQAVLDWLIVDGQPERRTVHLMGSLYSGAFRGHKALGLPDLGCLKKYEQNLCARLQLHLPESKAADAEGDALNPVRIKQVALYLTNRGGTRHLYWSDCVTFLDSLPSSWPCAPLKTLYAVLRLQGGGPGVQAWLSVLKDGVPETTRIFLLRAMVQGVPLATARYAVDHIDRRDWQDYIAITRNFDRCPGSEEWARIKGYLRTWQDIPPRRDLQIRYLTLVQHFPERKRETFLAAESLQAVLKILPTLRMMTRLAKTCSDKELVNIFQSCIDYDQALKSGNIPPFRAQSTLFYALLKIKSPLYLHLRPPQPLSDQALGNIEDDPDSSVNININPESDIQDTEALVWQFLATIMDELSDIEYKTDRHRISLYPHGSENEQTVLIPQLAEGSSGLHVCNWGRDDLLRFFRATEWNKVPDTLREYLAHRYSEPKPENTGDETGYLLELSTQDATSFEPEPEAELPPHSVEDLITAACRRDALNLAELKELARFREQLTLEQTVQIVQRIPAFVPEAVVSQWADLQQEKMTRAMTKDPLLLSSDEDIWSTLFEGSDDWLEAL